MYIYIYIYIYMSVASVVWSRRVQPYGNGNQSGSQYVSNKPFERLLVIYIRRQRGVLSQRPAL